MRGGGARACHMKCTKRGTFLPARRRSMNSCSAESADGSPMPLPKSTTMSYSGVAVCPLPRFVSKQREKALPNGPRMDTSSAGG